MVRCTRTIENLNVSLALCPTKMSVSAVIKFSINSTARYRHQSWIYGFAKISTFRSWRYYQFSIHKINTHMQVSALWFGLGFEKHKRVPNWHQLYECEMSVLLALVTSFLYRSAVIRLSSITKTQFSVDQEMCFSFMHRNLHRTEVCESIRKRIERSRSLTAI